ncbi:MAG: 2,3-bisphosphoglycerate-independent phosphoglycerate mutase [Bacteroidota bacterium]
MNGKKTALIILDGWGHGNKDANDAIYNAKTPFISGLYDTVPNAELLTHGEHVGLPVGQMGNSEVGHLNIGAGRIVYQDLAKINKACEDGLLAENEELKRAIDYAKKQNCAFHLIGLVSEGGVHSSQAHLHHLVDILEKEGLKKSFIHAFTDGRDTSPEKGKKYIDNLLNHLEGKNCELASIVGRYYAMDRDQRWERIQKAYSLLTNGEGHKSEDALSSIQTSYSNGITDEFIEPICLTKNDIPIARIQAGDVVLCFNFRTDRCRQISRALTQENFPENNMCSIDLHYVTMTRYDEDFVNVHVMFDKENLINTIGEVVSENGSSQLRAAETEKYPHVTFFFSGGREEKFDKEERIMANSPQVATYDLQPEMSAEELADKVCEHIQTKEPNFICLNFANPDMVGHTGDFEAIVKAVETTDQQCKKVAELARSKGYECIIIADHGNADLARNEDGSPHTAHTTNPVPIFYLGESFKSIQNGILADVSPSILSIMKIPQPLEMTGASLLE